VKSFWGGEIGDLWLSESLAILEYLEEKYPGSGYVLPVIPEERAKDRAILLWLRTDLFELRRCMPFECFWLWKIQRSRTKPKLKPEGLLKWLGKGCAP
jgi:glutathione S-transferase